MKYTLSLLAVLMLALNPAWSQQAAGNDPIVTIKTSEGDITLRLFREKSPVTVANFLS
ncbi:MAG TPA: peptidylprolyl isomerase, partial [Halieaceae bacterium]|nr:peptidylprolyl isomerase [Halieaceae bacterium]